MRYRRFGRSGLRVSEMILGCGLFGTRWGYGAEPQESRSIFDGFLKAGGNFLDTSDTYQLGQSEELLSDMIAANRDDLVVATKYTFGAAADGKLGATGNGRKNMIRSVEASLRRLKTDHIDLYWVHLPDAVTPTDEIMRGLDDLVRSGKIHYIGLSDFPAWRVARASTLAELRGYAPIVGIQIEYSLVERTPDRELMPMAAALGIDVAAWSPLGGGLLTGKYRRGETGRATDFRRLIHAEDDPRKTATLDALFEIADDIGSTPGRVAIAWVKARGALPIIGPRTRQQLDDNVAALDVRLTDNQVAALNSASAIALGFPHDLLVEGTTPDRLAGGRHADFDYPSQPVP